MVMKHLVHIKRGNKLYFILILIFILTVILCNNCFAQNNTKIKYYENVDKTYYYTNFVNEIPYFQVSRYNSYYEIIYSQLNNNIGEVIFYKDSVERAKWIYKYPKPDKIEIQYYVVKFELDENSTLKSNEEILIDTTQLNRIETLDRKEILYFDMKKLIKFECYSEDNRLKYYFEIKYKNEYIIQEYYFEPNGTNIQKYFYYGENKLIKYIIRKGIIISNENENEIITKSIIDEKWIYNNRQIKALEKYKNSNLYVKYYFNEYQKIIKKEIYNKMLRPTKFYLYQYDKDLNLINIQEYLSIDPFNTISSKNILLKEFSINESLKKYNIKEYKNNVLYKETEIDLNFKIIIENIYDEYGKLIKLSYKEIKDLDDYIIDMNPITELIFYPPDIF